MRAFVNLAVFSGFVACSAPQASPRTREQLAADEAALCDGVADGDRDRGPFAQPSDIQSVGRLMEQVRTVKLVTGELRGAEIVLRAKPGLTRQWLARVVRCHVAHHAVLGAAVQESIQDPLVVGAPSVSFDETETGFIVRIRGRNRDEGDEILRRSESLLTHHAEHTDAVH